MHSGPVLLTAVAGNQLKAVMGILAKDTEKPLSAIPHVRDAHLFSLLFVPPASAADWRLV